MNSLNLNVGGINNSDSIITGTGEATPKFVSIHANGSGNNSIVSAVSGKKIRVLAVWLVAAGTVNPKFQSGAGGTDLTGAANLVANGGYVLPYNPVGWFETAASTLLNLNLSSGTYVDGSLVYIEV